MEYSNTPRDYLIAQGIKLILKAALAKEHRMLDSQKLYALFSKAASLKEIKHLLMQLKKQSQLLAFKELIPYECAMQ